MNDLFWKDEAEEGIEAAERQAADAIRTLSALARDHPDRALVILGALRKIATIAGAGAQHIGLKAAQPQKGRE